MIPVRESYVAFQYAAQINSSSVLYPISIASSVRGSIGAPQLINAPEVGEHELEFSYGPLADGTAIHY